MNSSPQEIHEYQKIPDSKQKDSKQMHMQYLSIHQQTFHWWTTLNERN